MCNWNGATKQKVVSDIWQPQKMIFFMAAVLANIELRYFVINSHCITNPYAKRVFR